MTENAIIKTTSNILKKIDIAFAAYFIFVFLLLGILRAQYPFELELFEGYTLEHVQRILRGQKIYIAPGLDFVPFIYTPLYYLLSALLALFLGPSFFTLRMLSIMATFGVFILVYLFVKNETQSKTHGIIAAGLFAATYKICNTWFDIARIDSLYNFWLVFSIYLLRSSQNKYRIFISGILFTLAYFTKQSVILFLPPLVLSIFFLERKNAFKLAFFTATAIFVISIFLDVIHNGWFNYYTWKLPLTNTLDRELLPLFWSRGLLKPLWITILFIAAYFIKDMIISKNYTQNSFCFFILTGLLGLSFAATGNLGSNLNSMMPVYIGMAIMFGISSHRVISWLSNKEVVKLIVHLLIIIQFSILVYPPQKQLPSQTDKLSGRHFMDILKKINGPVWIPAHGYLATMAGKPAYANLPAMHEILRTISKQEDSAGKSFLQSLASALHQKKFSAVILDMPFVQYPELNNVLLENYELQGKLFRKHDGFVPLINKTRPELLYLPKGSTADIATDIPIYRIENIHKPGRANAQKGLIKRILAVAKDNSEYGKLNNMGISKATQGDMHAAKQVWLQALEINPQGPEAHANLGVFYERFGDLEKALQHYKIAAKELGSPWKEYADQLNNKFK
ncbi:glycosyltransferase family 39 protein [bacterium]|nr:glycosyltransferase family 39 protein [bacterium]